MKINQLLETPIDIANTAVHLDYTCITALATGCYVAVTAN